MGAFFLQVVNMSISASWLVLAVLVLRRLLKRAPKWVHVLLWGMVALRLVCPFSIESAMSLIPSAQTIPPTLAADAVPAIHSGIPVVNGAVNPVIADGAAPAVGAAGNPLQAAVGALTILWAVGILALLTYTAVSYWRLRRLVREATLLRDNIYQCQRVASPFVLGVVRPRIYLPYRLEGPDMTHVVAHEQAHIRRKDHWWKPLGFLLLTVHWFNPLLWLAYGLLCRDIELACDEKVIRELGGQQRAAYSQALLSCSVNRRAIAACPLAFGEVGVKERVQSVMRYKKPGFWVLAASAAACVAVAVCFLTNPAGPRTFPMSGRNVADLDPQQIVSEITRMEGLGDAVLHINEGDSMVHLTAGFDWVDAEVMRFFYTKKQQTYTAQLRLFFEDDVYFVTEHYDWPEQSTAYLFAHYLQALKHLPQEEIRQMAPDAEQYIVHLAAAGTPSDYDRVITYTPEGAGTIDGWHIHLQVQPMGKAEGGGYSGRGDEVIHVFYAQQEMSGASGAHTAPARWTYAPMLSASWHGFFHFRLDPAADYSHVEVSCDQGELCNLSAIGAGQPSGRRLRFAAGEPVCWWPGEGDDLTRTAEQAEIRFTVYNGEEILDSGALDIVRTGVRDGCSFYEARLRGANLLVLQQEDGNGGAALVRPGSTPGRLLSLAEGQPYALAEVETETVSTGDIADVLAAHTLADGTEILFYRSAEGNKYAAYIPANTAQLIRFTQEENGYTDGYEISEYTAVLGHSGFRLSCFRGAAYQAYDYYCFDAEGRLCRLAGCGSRPLEVDLNSDGQKELLWSYHGYELYYYTRIDGQIYLADLCAMVRVAAVPDRTDGVLVGFAVPETAEAFLHGETTYVVSVMEQGNDQPVETLKGSIRLTESTLEVRGQ